MTLIHALRGRLRAVFRSARAHQYGYQRLVAVRVSRNNLLHNCRIFQRAYAPAAVAPVLKSDAYGHGLAPAARIFEQANPPFLVVDGYYEALILRNEGISVPILVMGYTATENILKSRLPSVAYTLVDLAQLKELAGALRRPQRFHLKIDTGMRRYGIAADELDAALMTVGKARNMVLEGICSHMAKTISLDDSVAKAQIAMWNDLVHTVREAFPGVMHFHLASTGGSYWSQDIDANVIRLGLGAYGYDNSPRRALPLKPALSMVSTIGAVRHVAPGEGIGYGHTFIADRDMIVATVASGYYSGVDARLSNTGVFTVKGIPCPIVGRVCMNGTMIDVSAVPDVHTGDEVTLISQAPGDINSVTNIARMIGTSQHIVLASIHHRLRRVIA